jgi:hypothetical protein
MAHSPGPIGPETLDSPGPASNPKPYMLWCCIKMRWGECYVVTDRVGTTRDRFIVGSSVLAILVARS